MHNIIIINHNSTNSLIKCLESIIHSGFNGISCTLHVQDNASVDGVERIIHQFPEVDLTINSKNIGFSKAVNRALKKNKGEYAIILNPDTIIREDFFQNIIEYLDSQPDVGILGPRILNPDGTLQNSARSFPTLLTAIFGRNSILSRLFPNNSISSKNLLSSVSDGKTPMDVDWVSGACMVVRRKAIEEAGLLDERFFMYWEDADWCRRMREKGWRIVYYPKVTIYHSGGESSKKRMVRSLIDFHKSAYRLFMKYSPADNIIVKFFVAGGLSIRLIIVLIFHWLNTYFLKL